VDRIEATARMVASAATSSPSLMIKASTDQGTYGVGQPFQILVTETNTGSQAVGITTASTSPVTITRQGIEVWRFTATRPSPAPAIVLPPAQSLEQTVVWPDQFTEHRGLLRTGTFLAHDILTELVATATFRIVR